MLISSYHPTCAACGSIMIPEGTLHIKCVNCSATRPADGLPLQRPLLAVVADVHLANFRDFGGETSPDGLNRRGRLTLNVMARAVERAFELGCSLTVAGDLFHHKRPEPAIIAGAVDVLGASTGATKKWVIPGNHDTIDASAEGGNTACETVAHVAHVLKEHDWKQTEVDTAIDLVPFDARMPMAQFLEQQEFYKAPFKNRALVTHVGVVDDDSPPWLREASDAIHKDRLFDLMDREDITMAFVGNYHLHREWERGGRKIVQVGALNPTGFADAGLEGYGGFAVWYGGTDVRWESIPGPRFLRLRGEQAPYLPPGNSYFVRADRGKYGEKFFPDLAGFEEVDPEPTFVEQQDLARPDKLVEGSEAALEEYVGKMPLPDGLGRAEVLDAVKSLWRRSL